MAKNYDALYSKLTEFAINTFKRDDSTLIGELSDIFEEGYTAKYNEELLEYFKYAYLLPYWFREYPKLFDRDDLWLASRDQKFIGHHFGEWLGAILFYEKYLYRSLVEKYEKPDSKLHKHKGFVFKSLIDNDTFNFETAHESQPPDLFLYNSSAQLFCEIKRTDEKLTDKQRIHFKELRDTYKKKLVLLTLEEICFAL